MTDAQIAWAAIAGYLMTGAVVAGIREHSDPIIGLFWPLALAYDAGVRIGRAIAARDAEPPSKPDTF